MVSLKDMIILLALTLISIPIHEVGHYITAIILGCNVIEIGWMYVTTICDTLADPILLMSGGGMVTLVGLVATYLTRRKIFIYLIILGVATAISELATGSALVLS